MTTKIRITPDYETLRQLMGGDDAALVELRQSIAEEFARKHLKALVTTPTMQRAIADAQNTITVTLAAITEQVQKRVDAELGSWSDSWGGKKFTFTPKVAAALDIYIRTHMDSLIDAQVQAAVAARMGEQDVTSQIEQKVNAQVSAGINARVKAEVDRRIAMALRG